MLVSRGKTEPEQLFYKKIYLHLHFSGIYLIVIDSLAGWHLFIFIFASFHLYFKYLS